MQHWHDSYLCAIVPKLCDKFRLKFKFTKVSSTVLPSLLAASTNCKSYIFPAHITKSPYFQFICTHEQTYVVSLLYVNESNHLRSE